MREGLVSILLPAYNAEAFVGEAIESALAQTYRNWEVLVVNDGSTDRTEERVARYKDPRLKIYSKPNGGEASARNLGLSEMQGEFVAFLDADDAYLPNHLELAVCFLRARPGMVGVYTDGYNISPTGERQMPLSSRRRGPFAGDLYPEVVRSSDVLSPPLCVVLRSAVIRRNQLVFDESIGYGTDWDFFCRFAHEGPIGYMDEHTCLYRVHPDNMTRTVNRDRRRLWWARCREKAIDMPRFVECPPEIRRWVFYDLLVNLLSGDPERQSRVIQARPFQDLPADERASLLRRMASRAISDGSKDAPVREWLDAARELGPSDLRTRLLQQLLRLNPDLCRHALRLRRRHHPTPVHDPLFGDLGTSSL